MRVHAAIEEVSTEYRDRSRPARMLARARLFTLTAVLVLALSGVAAGGDKGDAADYPAFRPADGADVVIVFTPRAAVPMHLGVQEDRVVLGDVVRVEKGVAPKTIMQRRGSMGSPLEAGVPVKLFLRKARDGRGHYIIAVAPESYGGQP